MLRQNTKFFGGSDTGWGWATQLDLGGHTNKRIARYVLREGQTYALAVSGRSQRFNIDRIISCMRTPTKARRRPQRRPSPSGVERG